MKILIIIIVFAFLIIWFILKPNIATKNTSRPDEKPTVKKENDKFILVENVTEPEIKQALLEFCNMYNKNDYAAILRLSAISPGKFVITFPYDIDFVTFCFAINYLKYPTNVRWNAKVRAWATTKESDKWITEKSKNKMVMLFLADDDKEYDNVFLTTQDNIGYKLGFALGQEKKILNSPKEFYIKPTIDLKQIEDLKFEDID